MTNHFNYLREHYIAIITRCPSDFRSVNICTFKKVIECLVDLFRLTTYRKEKLQHLFSFSCPRLNCFTEIVLLMWHRL